MNLITRNPFPLLGLVRALSVFEGRNEGIISIVEAETYVIEENEGESAFGEMEMKRVTFL